MIAARRRPRALIALGLAGALAAGSGCAIAPRPAGVLPNGASVGDAVVRIGEFATVEAIAIAPTRAFVVAGGGVATYDRTARRWLAPLSLGTAGPRTFDARQSCAAVANMIGDAVWIACGSRVTVVRPAISAIWTSELGQPVSALAVSRGGADAWAFLGGGVAVVSSSGNARPLSSAETIPADRIESRAIVGATQALRAVNDPLLTRDDALRVWSPSAVAQPDGAGDTWIGTSGGGVFLADIDFHRSRQLPFGLRAGAVRAVARTATGVIVAEDPPRRGADRSLIATVSDDLSTWEWPSLYTSLGAVNAVAARQGVLCAGGELGAGLATLVPLAASPTAVLANSHRVFEPVRVVVAARDGCVVGTERGALIIPWTSGEGSGSDPRPLGTTPPVRALASSGDTIWIGTAGGLFRSISGGAASPLRLPPSIASNVVALALTDSGLAIAGTGEVWLLSGEGRVARSARPIASLGHVGRLTTLAFGAGTLWIGGSNGAIATILATGSSIVVPLDDPSMMSPPLYGGRDVRAIALAPGVAWIGTAAGIVRVRRGDDGMPR